MPTLKNELSASLPQLSKAVFSQPTDAAEYEKVTIRPIRLGGKLSFQAFRPNRSGRKKHFI